MASQIIPPAPSDNVTHIAAAKAKTGLRKFNAVDLDIVCLKVSEARAVCRVVALATAALIDHSVEYRDPNASRWWPALESAFERVQEVGSVLSETVAAPVADWWTPLNLLEALGAAMWHDLAAPGDTLDPDELEAFMRVAIGSLDQLADGIKGQLT